jgi:hypothetical protein
MKGKQSKKSVLKQATCREIQKPPIHWVLGALSQGVKRTDREADHSPPNSAEVKKTWIYISTPPYAFMV